MNNFIDAKDKDETLKQSMALTDIVKDLLDTTKAHLNRVYIILALSIIVNLLIVAGFLWYNSQFDYDETVTTKTVTTQEIDGNSDINNVSGDQYNDEAIHNEKK